MMSCKCVSAPFSCLPCLPRILATFLQPHPVKGMPWEHICWQSWGLEHLGLETTATECGALVKLSHIDWPTLTCPAEPPFHMS